MIVSIHQPDYLPYLGYFYKLLKSDTFIFLDDCQFTKALFHEYNRVKGPNGDVRIKLPVNYKFGSDIKDVTIKNDLKWRSNHLKTLEYNYKKAKFFDEVYPFMESLLNYETDNFSEFTININTNIARKLGYTGNLVKSSNFNVKTKSTQRLADLCKIFNADTYIAGVKYLDYGEDYIFDNAGIKVVVSDFKADDYKYDQLWGDFLPNMSIVDYLFNCGFKLFL